MANSSREKCAYGKCQNTKYRQPELYFPRFPTNDERREQWLLHADNDDLFTKTKAQLLIQCVCQRHFTDDCFMNSLHRSLTQFAIPTLDGKVLHDRITLEYPDVYNDGIDEVVIEAEVNNDTCPISLPTRGIHVSGEDVQMEECDVQMEECAVTSGCSPKQNPLKRDYQSTPCSFPHETQELKKISLKRDYQSSSCRRSFPNKTQELEKLRVFNEKLKVTIKRLRNQNHHLKKARAKAEARPLTREKVIDSASEFVSPAMLTLMRMSITHRAGQEWRKDEKQLALDMYHKSPSLYNYLRDDNNFVLPCGSTISRWHVDGMC